MRKPAKKIRKVPSELTEADLAKVTGGRPTIWRRANVIKRRVGGFLPSIQ